eukprot:3713974-Rhodomonas_salina.3
MERFGAILNPDPRVPVPSAKRGVVRAVYQYSSGCEFENAYETRGPKGGIKTLSGTRRRLNSYYIHPSDFIAILTQYKSHLWNTGIAYAIRGASYSDSWYPPTSSFATNFWRRARTRVKKIEAAVKERRGKQDALA